MRSRAVIQTIALAAASAVAVAQPTKPERAPVGDAEIRYQAGGSPLAEVEMHQDINPKAPPMTKAGVRHGAPDLLRALRRLSRRAAQGRHRQAADARHHACRAAPSTSRCSSTTARPPACRTGGPPAS